MLQIMSKVTPIPWNDVTLPEGRTVKACQVMIDKEKAKLKKAREEAGEPTIPLKATPKVREVVSARMRSALNIESSKQAAGAGKRKKASAVADEDGAAEKPAKKARKGKKSAELEDEDGEVEAPKKKGGAKKSGKKAAAAVKTEEDGEASGSAEPEAAEAAEEATEEGVGDE